MDFLKLIVSTTPAGVDAVTGRLYLLDVAGAEIENDDLENGEPPSGETKVIAYLPADASCGPLEERIRQSLSELRTLDREGLFGTLAVARQEVDGGWAENWKKYYKAQHVGKKLVVVPAWESFREEPGDVVVRMDPETVFGSGTHDSTRLCLKLLEELVNPGTALLDVGTGSGILAVSALLLGASSALATDVDPLAVKVASCNAALNGVQNRFRAAQGSLPEENEGRYSLILANIVADVILSLIPGVPGLLTSGGVFVCSGIIDAREDEVRAELAARGFEITKEKRSRGWVCLAAQHVAG